MIRLTVGCNDFPLDGWVNTDLEPTKPGVTKLDIREPLPFKNEEVEVIYSEHVIEHLDLMEGFKFFQECYRVLAVGGTLRVTTPNLQFVLSALTATPSDYGRKEWLAFQRWWSFSRYGQSPLAAQPSALINNYLISWGHKFVYDPATLKLSLIHAGFKENKVVQLLYGQSFREELNNVEHHHLVMARYGVPAEAVWAETFVMEALK